MNWAFEITAEDVEAVLEREKERLLGSAQRAAISEVAEEAIGLIDHGVVEASALDHANELDAQTDAAHEAIERELVRIGVLKAR